MYFGERECSSGGHNFSGCRRICRSELAKPKPTDSSPDYGGAPAIVFAVEHRIGSADATSPLRDWAASEMLESFCAIRSNIGVRYSLLRRPSSIVRPALASSRLLRGSSHRTSSSLHLATSIDPHTAGT